MDTIDSITSPLMRRRMLKDGERWGLSLQTVPISPLLLEQEIGYKIKSVNTNNILR